MAHSIQGRIAEQAYFLWLNEGMAHGRAADHWAKAERLVAQRELARQAAPVAVTAKPAAKPKTVRPSRAKAKAANVLHA